MLPYIHIGLHYILHLGGSIYPIGPFDIPTFGLMLWFATVCGAFVLHFSFRRANITDKQGEPADALGMVAMTVVAGIVGAKLWHVLDTPQEFRSDGWQVLWSSGGFAWFGGLVAGILALVIQGRMIGLKALRILDLASPAAAVGYAIGRLGCLTSGDGDYGIPTNLPWGMGFPNGLDPTPPGVRVHPTPLYEMIVGLLIGWWLWHRAAKREQSGASTSAPGELVGEYLLLTGIARFLVEFIRRNPHIFLGLSNAQLASLGSVAAGVALIWLSAARRPASKEPSSKKSEEIAKAV